jgi:hypothetical protein
MDRFPDCGELDVERSAFAGRRAYFDLPGMFLDNAVTHGKAQASSAAAGFGGEEGIKDAMDVFAGYAGPRIGHFDFDAAVVRGGADFEHSPARHGIARVQEKVQEDLLQLVG